MNLSGFHNIYWNNGIVLYSRIFYSTEVIPKLLSYIPFLIITFGLYFCTIKRKIDSSKKYIYLLLLVLLFMFFAKAAHAPFGDIFVYLFEHFSLFQIFRSAPEKFGYALAFLISISFAYGLHLIIQNIKQNSKRYFIIFMIIVSIIYFRIPWFNGDIIPGGKGEMTSFYINNIPKYYQELKNDFQGIDNARILNLPSFDRHCLWGTYDWGYCGINIIQQYINYNSIITPAISSDTMSQKLRDLISSKAGETVHAKHYNNDSDLISLMSLMSINEVLVNNDRVFISEHYSTTNPNKILNTLNKNLPPEIYELKEYGKGKIYRYILKDKYSQELIYIPKVIYNSLDSFLLEKSAFKDNAIINLQDAGYQYSNPKINFEKISRNKYKVIRAYAHRSLITI